jgi:hypothetical protein
MGKHTANRMCYFYGYLITSDNMGVYTGIVICYALLTLQSDHVDKSELSTKETLPFKLDGRGNSYVIYTQQM